jgi:hypothetical protein
LSWILALTLSMASDDSNVKGDGLSGMCFHKYLYIHRTDQNERLARREKLPDVELIQVVVEKEGKKRGAAFDAYHPIKLPSRRCSEFRLTNKIQYYPSPAMIHGEQPNSLPLGPGWCRV